MTKPPRTPDRLGVTVGRDRQFAPVCQWRAACRTRQVVMRVQLPHGALRLVFQPQTGLQRDSATVPQSTSPSNKAAGSWGQPVPRQGLGLRSREADGWQFLGESIRRSKAGHICVSKEFMAQGLTPRRVRGFQNTHPPDRGRKLRPGKPTDPGVNERGTR